MKRIISALLALLMAATSFVTVFATEAAPAEDVLLIAPAPAGTEETEVVVTSPNTVVPAKVTLKGDED